MRSVIIGLESRETVFGRAYELARRADHGETLPESDYFLNFGSLQQLFNELTPERLRIVETLIETGGQTSQNLTLRLARAEKEITTDINALMQHDLVAKNEHNQYFVPWGTVEFRLCFGVGQAKAA